MADPRIAQVAELLLELASGNLEARGIHSTAGDEVDAIIAGINMLAEELAAQKAALDRNRQERLKKLQARLAHADRLTAIGRLAAGVAHEVNNPAATITANLDTELEVHARLIGGIEALRASGELDERARNAVEGALEQFRVDQGLADMEAMLRDNSASIGRIAGIVRELSAFSRIERDGAAALNINDIVEAACNISVNEIRHRAVLVKELGRVPEFVGDRARLTQVVVNILINAAHAIEPGRAEDNRVVVRTLHSDHRVFVSVEDTGCGIPEADLELIFEPFYTTKPRDVGTGLGLALSLETVEKHGGEITVESRLGRGSIVRIAFPEQTGLVASAKSERKKAPTPAVVGARILVVDDEVNLRRALRRLLSDHDVVEAGGGREALDILATDSRFDLVLCDLMMPDGDGEMVYSQLRDEHSALAERIVFISGGTFTPTTERFLSSIGAPVLNKPFRRHELLELVGRFAPA